MEGGLLAGVFLFGAIVGSFLNVVIYRVPRGLSLIKPGSHCPHCGRPVKPWENIPIISFILLGGRCAGCHKPISWRYPVVEGLTGGLMTVVIWRFGLTGEAVLYCVLVALLVALSFIDLATYRLPDPIVFTGMLLALVLNLALRPGYVTTMLMGAGVGLGLLLFMYGVGWLMFRKETLGWGDVKLGGMIGLFVGPAHAAGMFVFAILLGALIGGAILLFSGRGWGWRIPFGPYISVGTLVSLFWGEKAWEWYIGIIYRGWG